MGSLVDGWALWRRSRRSGRRSYPCWWASRSANAPVGWSGSACSPPFRGSGWFPATPTSDRPGSRRGALVDGAIAGAGFGMLFIALAQISTDAGLLPLAANQLTGAVLTLVVATSLRQPWRPRRGVVGWGSVSGVLGASGTLAFMVATGTTSLGIAGVLASLYPVVTVLLAASLLGERIGVGQRTGIGICTLAVSHSGSCLNHDISTKENELNRTSQTPRSARSHPC